MPNLDDIHYKFFPKSKTAPMGKKLIYFAWGIEILVALVGLTTTNSAIDVGSLDTLFLLLLLFSIFISRKISNSINSNFGFGDIVFLIGLSLWFDTFTLSIVVFLAAASMVLIFLLFKMRFSWTLKTGLPFGPALAFFAVSFGFNESPYMELGIV